MKKLANLIPSIMIVLFLLVMAGCSGGGGGESDPVNVQSETSDKPGVSIKATTYADASTIEMFIDSDSGMGYVLAEEGAVLNPGTKAKMGVRVSGGSFAVDKVFVGDGGSYQVTARYNKDLNLYLFDYRISDTDNLIPILVQAVHTNGLASKDKFVFTNMKTAKADELVRDGLGILVGADVLGSAAGMELSGLTINSLKPKAGHSIGVLEADIGLGVRAVVGLSDGLAGNETEEVLPTLNLLLSLFGGITSLPIDMGINSMLLDDMLGSLAGGFGADMSGLKLDKKPLYLDINGLPDDTTVNMAALSMGLFMAEDTDPAVFPAGVKLYQGNDAIDFDSYTSNDPSAIEISLSQANMTQFLGSLLEGNVVLDALDIPTAVSTANIEKKMKISIKKEGVAFDFKTRLDEPLLIINDLRIDYIEEGIMKWTMSLDLAFILRAGSHDEDIVENAKKDYETYLDIYLTLVPEYARCAVLKDNQGITMFDKSPFAISLVDGLKDMLPSDDPQKGDLLLSIPTGALLGDKITDDGFGLILSGATSASDAGRCYLTMATQDADLSKAGLCFVNTAN